MASVRSHSRPPANGPRSITGTVTDAAVVAERDAGAAGQRPVRHAERARRRARRRRRCGCRRSPGPYQLAALGRYTYTRPRSVRLDRRVAAVAAELHAQPVAPGAAGAPGGAVATAATREGAVDGAPAPARSELETNAAARRTGREPAAHADARARPHVTAGVSRQPRDDGHARGCSRSPPARPRGRRPSGWAADGTGTSAGEATVWRTAPPAPTARRRTRAARVWRLRHGRSARARGRSAASPCAGCPPGRDLLSGQRPGRRRGRSCHCCAAHRTVERSRPARARAREFTVQGSFPGPCLRG